GQIGNQKLLEALLYEAGDWKELAGLPALVGFGDAADRAAYRAAFHRLAGNAREMEEALAEVRQRAEGARDVSSHDKAHGYYHAAKAFYLNDRPADGLELMAKSWPDSVLHRCWILRAQCRYAEALALLDTAQVPRSDGLTDPELLKSATLVFLGEKEK